MRRAVIDIGTNSVKLLVAEVEGDAVHPLWEESIQTRLGQGFYAHHRLQPDPIRSTAQAVARFAAQARERSAATLRVIATSAVRDAVNREELLAAIAGVAGLDVEVITGDQEADWVFAGVQTEPGLSGRHVLIVDIGGGSTEFVLGRSEHPRFRRSFPLGTVRLLEQMAPADPPSSSDWAKCRSAIDHLLRTQVQGILQPHLNSVAPAPVLLVGTGGTTSILAAMEAGLAAFDRGRIEQVTLSQNRIWELQKALWSRPIAERKQMPGLPPNRADVILFGVAVFALIMEVFGFGIARASTRGLRFAAVRAD